MAETQVIGAPQPSDGDISSEVLSEAISSPDPSGLTFLGMRQRAKAEILAAYFDPMADNWEIYRERNAYFHRTQRALFRTYVPPGLAVLELGCATGDLLAAVRPGRGVGVDLSRRMVEKARRKYPALEFVEADATFFDTAGAIRLHPDQQPPRVRRGYPEPAPQLPPVAQAAGASADQHAEPDVDPLAADRRAAPPVHSRHPAQLRHRPGCGQSPGLERFRGREADAPDAPSQEDPRPDLAGQLGGGAIRRWSGDSA